MKIIFWNIDKKLTIKKLAFLGRLMDSEKPDIFCVAEGSYSQNDCNILEMLFTDRFYKIYYSPSFVKTKKGYKYPYNRNGLKIFYKTTKKIEKTIDECSTLKQREQGRIVALDLSVKYKKTTIIFIHNRSKNGTRDTNRGQEKYITRISDLIDLGYGKSDSKPIVIGDFNLEPWDNILRDKDFIETSFLKKHNSISLRKNSFNLYNPIVDKIYSNKEANLGGTYYDNTFGWALYDYVLYPTKDYKLIYNIVTRIGGDDLINTNNTVKNDLILNELDHLPIIIKI